MILLSIDPGVRSCGCALWRGGRLEAAALVFGLEKGVQAVTRLGLGDAVAAMSRAVAGWARALPPDRVACELPQTYRGRAERGDANDLIALAVVVGAVVECLGAPTTLVRPHDWKGSAPKGVTEARVLRDLSPEELSRVALPRARSLQHNVWDAVGIGLHHLGR